MPDNNSEFVPSLTLSPSDAPAGVAIAAATADPAAVAAQRDATAVKLDLSQLTEAEKKQVIDFSEKIDITDTNTILTYGASAQKNIANFSGSTLNSVRTKDMGDVGQMLSGLVVQLKGMNCGE
ncbi:MAG: toxic anion resistance protein, partial [Oscillospiraceae bacterium]|nr:toxic anion resistance protein [Oscillospiraceae bacterium]